MHRRDVVKAIGLALIPWAMSTRAGSGDAINTILDALQADEHPDLMGVIIRSGGDIAGERYYNGQSPASLQNIRSVGKSVTSLLLGIAIDKGSIRSVKDPVKRYWPEAKGSAIGEVTLSDLLTMRSGLAADDNNPDSAGHEEKLNAAPEPARFLLSVPQATPAGSAYVYNSLCAFAVGLLIEKATGKKLADFARDVLFKPLGISQFTWGSYAAGHTMGQGNLSLTTRDLSSIGQVVLGEGKFGHHRIVNKSWVAESLKPWVDISGVDPYAGAYGYFWFAQTYDAKGTPTPVYYASGNGGNKVYVVPSRDLVIAITSSAYGQGYGQRRSQDILKAVLAADI